MIINCTKDQFNESDDKHDRKRTPEKLNTDIIQIYSGITCGRVLNGELFVDFRS